jgi:hypothetical protein
VTGGLAVIRSGTRLLNSVNGSDTPHSPPGIYPCAHRAMDEISSLVPPYFLRNPGTACRAWRSAYSGPRRQCSGSDTGLDVNRGSV